MGMGGHLMWTGVARNLQQKKGLKLMPTADGKKSSIFNNNPNISSEKEGSLPVHFQKYTYLNDGARVTFKNKEHVIAWTCKKIGLADPIDLKCEIYLTEEEKKQVGVIKNDLPKEYICIEPHSKMSWSKGRLYPFEKWQKTINSLKDKFTFVQIGSPKSRPLENVIFMNGKLSFRETYGILENASLFLSSEGGLVHLSNAASTMSIVIFTSYHVHPSTFHYPENKMIDISLFREEIGGYKDHPLYEKERQSHDENEIIESILSST